MNRSKTLIRTAGISTLLCLMQPVFAQPSGLVNVGLMNVVETIATNIRIEPSQIPLNVRVPVDIAAHVCQISADALSRQGKGEGGQGCQAQTSSTALEQIILRQVKENNRK